LLHCCQGAGAAPAAAMMLPAAATREAPSALGALLMLCPCQRAVCLLTAYICAAPNTWHHTAPHSSSYRCAAPNTWHHTAPHHSTAAPQASARLASCRATSTRGARSASCHGRVGVLGRLEEGMCAGC
jgi:hypothetical protein